MTEKIKLPPSLLAHTPWENGTNPIWLATSYLLHRNLGKFNFPPKMDERQFEQIMTSLNDSLHRLIEGSLLVKAEEISALDKEYLFEHFLCMEGFQNTLHGQGFVVDGTGSFLAKLNIQNHLQMQLIDTLGSWEKVWNQLSEIETAI